MAWARAEGFIFDADDGRLPRAIRLAYQRAVEVAS